MNDKEIGVCSECGSEYLQFQITSLENGWIFAEISNADKKVHLANSYLGGQELPKAMLHALNRLLSEDSSTEWICWHGESQAFIWHLERQGRDLHLEVFRAGYSFGFPVYGDGLEEIANKAELIVSLNADIWMFAQTVCDAFKEYRFGEKSEQWQCSGFGDYFPNKEYQMLRRRLRNKQR